MSSPHPLAWVPPHHNAVSLLPAGRWWDAVRVRRELADAVLTALGPRSGAVIEDSPGGLLYWLVEPGSATRWPELPGVRVRGRDGFIGVPAQHKVSGSGVSWRVPLAPGRYLTDPAALLAALTEAAR